MRLQILSIATCLVLLGGCSAAEPQEQASAGAASRSEASEASAVSGEGAGAQGTAPRRVDPRDGGLEVALGEWAIAPESDAIRPGPVVFVIHNRGTVPHGFEIEIEGDSSGHGSGDLFKAESRLLQPGQSTRMSFDLDPAVYKIECLVDGHDDMGMEGLLTVRHGAPLVAD